MIGRSREVKELNRLYDSGRAELVAVYGRRRVGKTYLVNETFSDRITFFHAGLAPTDGAPKGALREQLDRFYHSLEAQGAEKGPRPNSWLEAFGLLEMYLQRIDDGSRQLVFLDELPWFDTPRSGFLRAFEAFWNGWGCRRKNLMVVVCGSANSWIQDRLINNHGGLYDRVTYEISLSPFSLYECEEFCRARNLKFSRYDIVQGYMTLGGIPYYWGYMDGEASMAQNIDALFFAKKAKLKLEFDRLFDSVFTAPESTKQVVTFLSGRNAGFTRKELVEKLEISDGGGVTRVLNALLASDFVEKYVPFGWGKREEHFKLVDPFCLFYLRFLSNRKETSARFWRQNSTSHSVAAWRGLAFENVCFNHIDQIKNALGVSGVNSTESAWLKRGDGDVGAQIDMLISRADNVVDMCEMKFYGGNFTVDKEYYKTLLNRQELLLERISRKQSIRNVLVTTFGLTRNEYAGIFDSVVTLEDLFAF